MRREVDIVRAPDFISPSRPKLVDPPPSRSRDRVKSRCRGVKRKKNEKSNMSFSRSGLACSTKLVCKSHMLKSSLSSVRKESRKSHALRGLALLAGLQRARAALTARSSIAALRAVRAATARRAGRWAAARQRAPEVVAATRRRARCCGDLGRELVGGSTGSTRAPGVGCQSWRLLMSLSSVN